MKTAGALAALWALLGLTLVFASLGLSIYGIVLAFSASVILGVISIFIQPMPLVFGAAQFFFHVNLPVLIMTWISSHQG